MGTNGQALLSASSSADPAGEGGAMRGGFPFVILSGGGGESAETVNPVFEAYARRSVAPGRTAREALVLALAETEDAAAASGAGADTARVDEASYGVTRSPFASVSAPTPRGAAKTDVAPPAPSPVVAKPHVAAAASAPDASKKENASRRRPALRTTSAATEAPIPVASAAPIPMPVSQPASAPTPADAVPPSVDSSIPPEATAATETAAAGKPKIALRRGVPAATRPPVPAPPPADAPLFFGPVMDGSRSPLVPLPVASGAPGGGFVPPAHVMTRSPFPAAGGAAPVVPGAGASASSAGKPPTGVVARREAAAARALERRAAGRRVAVVGASLLALGLVSYFGYQSPYWPFRLKQVAVAGEAASASEPAASASTTAARETAASTRAASASALVEAVAHPTRPAPGAGFVGVLERLKITGVLQGEPVRAIIDGRLVQAGDLVDVMREVRLVGLDVTNRQLIFEDRTTARANVRY